MKIYTNDEIHFNGCPGCAYAKHEFELPCGLAYENDNFVLSQDWELPIDGFLIVSPKRHIEQLSELTDNERNEMFGIVNKTIKILRENNVCDRFEIIIEEKENRHLHVWIMPRHEWMIELVDSIIDNIGVILEYAKTNFRNKDVYEKINNTIKIVKENF
jgi:diadenosine tetraphosphate (Ap4A) HIT family hydrolase